MTVSRNIVVAFERIGEGGRNALNEVEEVWAEIGRSWAEVRELTAAEAVEAGQETASLVVRVTVRSNPVVRSLTARDRISFAGASYNIKSVLREAAARHRHIVLTAARVPHENET